MKTTKSFVAALMFCSSLVASQALADGKNYPGSVCEKWGGSGTVVYDGSRIGNSHVSGTVSVDCPAIKDAGATTSAYARVLDRSSGNISCTMVDAHVLLNDGNVVHYDTDTDATSGTSNNHQQLDFGGQTSVASSYKFLSCSIPANDISGPSYIAMFNIVEA